MTDADLDALVARLSEHQTFALPADTPDKTQAIIEQMCFDGAEAADALTSLSAQLESAREDERAKVVAWLRDPAHEEWVVWAIADAIERGQHRGGSHD